MLLLSAGPHRYVFLVFQQPGKIDFQEPHIALAAPTAVKVPGAPTRSHFSVRHFSKKYGLDGVPVAGNYVFVAPETR